MGFGLVTALVRFIYFFCCCISQEPLWLLFVLEGRGKAGWLHLHFLQCKEVSHCKDKNHDLHPWIHTCITKITSYPDFSKVVRTPAKHLEIRPRYSLQHWQLKIFRQQNSSFYSKAEGKIFNLLLCFFENRSVKRDLPESRCLFHFKFWHKTFLSPTSVSCDKLV